MLHRDSRMPRETDRWTQNLAKGGGGVSEIASGGDLSFIQSFIVISSVSSIHSLTKFSSLPGEFGSV